MVEGLAGQGTRLIHAHGAAALAGDAGHRLHQAVEAAALAPRPRVAEGRERHVDDAGPELGHRLGREAVSGDGAGPVALAEDIGLADEPAQPLRVRLEAEIERRRELAAAHVLHEHLDAGQMGGGDLHHVRAVLGERPPAHGSRDHAGEIQHANPRQRPGARGQGLGRRGPDADDLQRQEHGQRLGMRMGLPLLGHAQHARAHLGARERVLELGRLPALDGRRHRVALLLHPEEAQHALAVVGKLQWSWIQRASAVR